MAPRIESTHTRVKLTTPGGDVLDLEFPAEIGDGDGQIPEDVAAQLLSLSSFPGEYTRTGDAPPPELLDTNSQGHDGDRNDDDPDDGQENDPAGDPAEQTATPKRRGRKKAAADGDANA